MSRADTLAALAELQGRFSRMLRTPLDRSTLTLRAPVEGYDAALVAEVTAPTPALARERLAVYQRQYWFRLFGVLQRAYPLLARLLGMWRFNALAARYLTAHPPHGHDLGTLGDALPSYLEGTEGAALLPGPELAWAHEAARLDHTFTRVFSAPATRPLDATALTPARLPQLALALAPSVAFFTEHYPLVSLRRQALALTGEATLPQPLRSDAPSHWVIFRTPSGHGVGELDALAFALYRLLAARPLGEALGELEALVAPGERATLPARVQALLRDSVEAGFWCAP